jgi:MoaA/NifB/PqqE/SkfB family radical SAM enzyme
MTVFLANAHEAAPLVVLAHRLGIDAVMLMHLNGGEAYNWIETKPDGWVFDYRANLPTADPKHIRACLDEAVAAAAALNYELIVDPRLQALMAVGTSGASKPQPAAPAQPSGEIAPSPPAGSGYGSCRTPWHWLNIAANGDVSPCCWARRPLANLNDAESLAAIWNGRRIRELRQNIRDNRVDPEICEGASCVYVASAGQ